MKYGQITRASTLRQNLVPCFSFLQSEKGPGTVCNPRLSNPGDSILGPDSLLLYGLQIVGNVLQPHLAEILIPFKIVKNRSPDRHLARAMGGRPLPRAGDLRFHPATREHAAVIPRDLGQVGDPIFERNSCRAAAAAIFPVTDGAMVPENLASINLDDGRRFGLVLLGCCDKSETTNRDAEYAGGKKHSSKRHFESSANRSAIRPYQYALM